MMLQQMVRLGPHRTRYYSGMNHHINLKRRMLSLRAKVSMPLKCIVLPRNNRVLVNRRFNNLTLARSFRSLGNRLKLRPLIRRLRRSTITNTSGHKGHTNTNLSRVLNITRPRVNTIKRSKCLRRINGNNKLTIRRRLTNRTNTRLKSKRNTNFTARLLRHRSRHLKKNRRTMRHQIKRIRILSKGTNMFLRVFTCHKSSIARIIRLRSIIISEVRIRVNNSIAKLNLLHQMLNKARVLSLVTIQRRRRTTKILANDALSTNTSQRRPIRVNETVQRLTFLNMLLRMTGNDLLNGNTSNTNLRRVVRTRRTFHVTIDPILMLANRIRIGVKKFVTIRTRRNFGKGFIAIAPRELTARKTVLEQRIGTKTCLTLNRGFQILAVQIATRVIKYREICLKGTHRINRGKKTRKTATARRVTIIRQIFRRLLNGRMRRHRTILRSENRLPLRTNHRRLQRQITMRLPDTNPTSIRRLLIHTVGIKQRNTIKSKPRIFRRVNSVVKINSSRLPNFFLARVNGFHRRLINNIRMGEHLLIDVIGTATHRRGTTMNFVLQIRRVSVTNNARQFARLFARTRSNAIILRRLLLQLTGKQVRFTALTLEKARRGNIITRELGLGGVVRENGIARFAPKLTIRSHLMRLAYLTNTTRGRSLPILR